MKTADPTCQCSHKTCTYGYRFVQPRTYHRRLQLRHGNSYVPDTSASVWPWRICTRHRAPKLVWTRGKRGCTLPRLRCPVKKPSATPAPRCSVLVVRGVADTPASPVLEAQLGPRTPVSPVRRSHRLTVQYGITPNTFRSVFTKAWFASSAITRLSRRRSGTCANDDTRRCVTRLEIRLASTGATTSLFTWKSLLWNVGEGFLLKQSACFLETAVRHSGA